jgi:hypothetical protein
VIDVYTGLPNNAHVQDTSVITSTVSVVIPKVEHHYNYAQYASRYLSRSPIKNLNKKEQKETMKKAKNPNPKNQIYITKKTKTGGTCSKVYLS